MKWVKNNKIKSLLLLFVFVLLIWFLFSERQAELSYRVDGSEILQIKKECKDLAEAKLSYYNNSRIGLHQLVGHGYSEFGGYCYAEFLQNFGDESKLLYNTTQDREVFRRAWPKDVGWYYDDFDRFVLGKRRIIDF